MANDTRIVEAHRAAIEVAVGELEQFAAARLPRSGANSDRLTGNIVAALFEHETSRALDPHLHTHCIVFNATHDDAGLPFCDPTISPSFAADRYTSAEAAFSQARESIAVKSVFNENRPPKILEELYTAY